MKITAEVVLHRVDNYLDEWIISVRNRYPIGSKSPRVLVPQGAEFSGSKTGSGTGHTLDLSGLDLKGKDFHFTLFKNADLKGVDFTDCDLRFAQFRNRFA